MSVLKNSDLDDSRNMNMDKFDLQRLLKNCLHSFKRNWQITFPSYQRNNWPQRIFVSNIWWIFQDFKQSKITGHQKQYSCWYFWASKMSRMSPKISTLFGKCLIYPPIGIYITARKDIMAEQRCEILDPGRFISQILSRKIILSNRKCNRIFVSSFFFF